MRNLREQQAKVNHLDTNEQTEAQGDHQDERAGHICSASGGQNLSAGKKTGTAAQAWPEMKTIKKAIVERSGWCREKRAVMIYKLRCPLSRTRYAAGCLLASDRTAFVCVCVCVSQHSGDAHSPINTHMQGYMQNEPIRANGGVSFSCFIGLWRTKAMC